MSIRASNPCLSRALNVNLGLPIKSLSGLLAYFVDKTEPKILLLVFMLISKPKIRVKRGGVRVSL